MKTSRLSTLADWPVRGVHAHEHNPKWPHSPSPDTISETDPSVDCLRPSFLCFLFPRCLPRPPQAPAPPLDIRRQRSGPDRRGYTRGHFDECARCAVFAHAVSCIIDPCDEFFLWGGGAVFQIRAQCFRCCVVAVDGEKRDGRCVEAEWCCKIVVVVVVPEVCLVFRVVKIRVQCILYSRDPRVVLRSESPATEPTRLLAAEERPATHRAVCITYNTFV